MLYLIQLFGWLLKPISNMRLKSFRIKNYGSIFDTDKVELSDNVLVLAGQNESGKSAALKALRDFQKKGFEKDYKPVYVRMEGRKDKAQFVSCTFELEDSDDLAKMLLEFLQEFGEVEDTVDVSELDISKIEEIKKFQVTKEQAPDQEPQTILDTGTAGRLYAFLRNNATKLWSQPSDGDASPSQETEEVSESAEELEATEENRQDQGTAAENSIKNLVTEKNKEGVYKFAAKLFYLTLPEIVFFDNQCDLLPDRIYITDLKSQKAKKGYRATKNFEKIRDISFITLENEEDLNRKSQIDRGNQRITTDFQEDWKQQIHNENQVKIEASYNESPRGSTKSKGPYILFSVSTKENEYLPPKQRSKGLIWFLSLWLELKAREKAKNRTDLILLLDEPDQHLHIKAQKDMLNLINTLATEVNRDDKSKSFQIIYSTHSPYLLEMREHPDRIKLVANTKKYGTLIDKITSARIGSKYKEDALLPLADALGFEACTLFPLAGNGHILLEGRTDAYYFTGMARLLRKGKGYNFVPGSGVLSLKTPIGFSIGYNIPWVAVIDGWNPQGGEGRPQKAFNEIVEDFFGGDKKEAEKNIYVLPENSIEAMFTPSDFIQFRPKDIDVEEPTKIGDKQKWSTAFSFLGEVKLEEIKKSDLSETTIEKFEAVFKFIDKKIKFSKKK